jgi:excisionase family DNA binding protein
MHADHLDGSAESARPGVFASPAEPPMWPTSGRNARRASAAEGCETACDAGGRTAPRLVDVDELAGLLRASTSTIYRLVARERIPCLRVGSGLRFDAAAVVAALGGEAVARPRLRRRARPVTAKSPGVRREVRRGEAVSTLAGERGHAERLGAAAAATRALA